MPLLSSAVVGSTCSPTAALDANTRDRAQRFAEQLRLRLTAQPTDAVDAVVHSAIEHAVEHLKPSFRLSSVAASAASGVGLATRSSHLATALPSSFRKSTASPTTSKAVAALQPSQSVLPSTRSASSPAAEAASDSQRSATELSTTAPPLGSATPQFGGEKDAVSQETEMKPAPELTLIEQTAALPSMRSDHKALLRTVAEQHHEVSRLRTTNAARTDDIQRVRTERKQLSQAAAAFTGEPKGHHHHAALVTSKFPPTGHRMLDVGVPWPAAVLMLLLFLLHW